MSFEGPPRSPTTAVCGGGRGEGNT
jgi:hypothetical protein